MDVIFVLWLRQMRGFMRARARIVSTMVQPFLLLVALGFGFGPVFAKAGEGNYFVFLIPGVIGSTMLFNAVFSGADLLSDRQFGFLKVTLAAPVPRSRIMLGRALGVTSVSLLQGVIVAVVCGILGFHYPGIGRVLLAILFASMAAFLFAMIGSILGSVMTDSQAFSQIVNFVVSPLFYLSGAVFPLEGQRTVIRNLALLNPLTYGIDGMRYALVGQHVFPPSFSLVLLAILDLVFLGIATYSFSRIQP